MDLCDRDVCSECDGSSQILVLEDTTLDIAAPENCVTHFCGCHASPGASHVINPDKVTAHPQDRE